MAVSALYSEADIARQTRNVRKMPISEVSGCNRQSYRSVGRRRNFKNSPVVKDRYIRLREREGSPERNLIGGQDRSAESVLQRFDNANSAKPVSADEHRFGAFRRMRAN